MRYSGAGMFRTAIDDSDERVHTLYSAIMDFLTFMTAEFDEHRHDVRP